MKRDLLRLKGSIFLSVYFRFEPFQIGIFGLFDFVFLCSIFVATSTAGA